MCLRVRDPVCVCIPACLRIRVCARMRLPGEGEGLRWSSSGRHLGVWLRRRWL